MRLNRDGLAALAAVLGETPETIISVHLLRRGLCRAWAVQAPPAYGSAVVQWDDLPDEPEGYGEPEGILRLLERVEGWWCVNVPREIESAVAEGLVRRTGRAVRCHGDVYHVLERPAAAFDHADVRRLRVEDLPRLDGMERKGLRLTGYGSVRAALAEGVVAGAIVDGRVVALADANARGERYANVGVATAEDHRGRGYATAAASLVCREMQAAGRTPVWSAGETNAASLRVAGKLGFVAVTRKTYVILEPR